MRAPENLSSSTRAPCSSAGTGVARKGLRNRRAGGQRSGVFFILRR